MTVISLASISLLALVVTAAPLPAPNDASHASEVDRVSLEVQNGVQTLFESRLGRTPDCITGCEPEAQLPAKEKLEAVLPAQEEVEPSNDELLAVVDEHAAQALAVELGEPQKTSLAAVQRPVVGFTFRQARANLTYAALGVTVGCVFGLLWLTYSFTRPAPIQLPLHADPESDSKTTPTNAKAESAYPNEKALVLDMERVFQSTTGPAVVDEEKRALQQADTCTENDSSDNDSESGDELNEKFEDAEDLLDSPSEPSVHVLPQITVQEHHPDPDLLPLPSARPSTPFMTPPPSPLRRPSPLTMREANASLSRPAWSIRAADAAPLGLTNSTPALRPSSSPSPSPAPPAMRVVSSAPVSLPSSRPDTPIGTEPMHVPGAFSDTDEYDQDAHRALAQARRGRSAYRAPVPEIDIAFALQLRPGLGMGSDPAWLVRFLMAMFGWMTVFIGNGQQGASGGRRVIA